MLSRSAKSYTPLVSKRFQHAAAPSPAKSTFTNKYNFDLSPPQTHKYWNLYNSSLVFGIGVSVFAFSGYIYGGYFDAVNAASFSKSAIRKPFDK
ncbi:hypothetical protein CLIB1423_25S00958 [[Candida] railenensis]|uniref:Uncharacterized protein n=1 Tax=[Candida] railenensis TaxID=45579 RepID=A0A9P0W171_9ASCO|nr:hypothetical protein CLIB1423_25S00958 [[Candida] railenensis]